VRVGAESRATLRRPAQDFLENAALQGISKGSQWLAVCSLPQRMRNVFEGAEHLIRLAVVAVLVLLAFLAIRQYLVPADFGKYGHFRPASLDEIAARTPVFAGRAACAECHQDVAEAKSKGPHVNVGCEACHGPAGRHAQDFSSQKPLLPDTAKLCVVCHEADGAKPKAFPQVVSRDHANGVACGTCHNPHQPKL
jgi:hypothetical protein